MLGTVSIAYERRWSPWRGLAMNCIAMGPAQPLSHIQPSCGYIRWDGLSAHAQVITTMKSYYNYIMLSIILVFHQYQLQQVEVSGGKAFLSVKCNNRLISVSVLIFVRCRFIGIGRQKQMITSSPALWLEMSTWCRNTQFAYRVATSAHNHKRQLASSY